MKKVLVVVKTLSLGGVSSVIFTYFQAMTNPDLHLDFATGDPVEPRYLSQIESRGSTLFKTNKDGGSLSYIHRIADIVKTGGYDTVHVHGNSTMILPDLLGARLGGAKKVIAHSHNTTCNHPGIHKLLRPLFDLAYTDALSCGEDAGKWMFGKRPFQVLKNGICLEENQFSSEKRSLARSDLEYEAGNFVIGHVGLFNYQKNQSYLIDIFAAYQKQDPKARLLLVGDGDTMEEVREKVLEMGLQDCVHFYGTSDRVGTLLDAMDMLVFPSRFEGLPCVLVEAQAHGLPCLVSDRVTEEAKMSDWFFFEQLEAPPEQWADRISKIRADLTDREHSCLENQRMLAERGYDISASAKILEKLYLGE